MSHRDRRDYMREFMRNKRKVANKVANMANKWLTPRRAAAAAASTEAAAAAATVLVAKKKSTPSLISLPLKEKELTRIYAFFRRRSATPLDAAEQRAWKNGKAAVISTTEDEWKLLEWVYSRTSGDAFKFRRKDMATLLNNWNGEIDRAFVWKGKSRPKVDGEVKEAGAVANEIIRKLKTT